jgi:hypothetical protein
LDLLALLSFSFLGGADAPLQWQTVALASRAAHLGGVSWFFICPLTGQLCRRLILPRGGSLWASRRGYGLGYASQRETARARAIRRYVRLERKLIDGKLNHKGQRVRLQRRTRARLSSRVSSAWSVVAPFL